VGKRGCLRGKRGVCGFFVVRFQKFLRESCGYRKRLEEKPQAS
jgi:hypothetical protein